MFKSVCNCITIISFLGFIGAGRVVAEEIPPREFILMIGQSNMEGRGNGAFLKREFPEIAEGIKSTVKIVKTTKGKLGEVSVGRKFGPEVMFAYELSQKYPDTEFAIIKVAKSGTSMRSWSPGGKMYNKSVRRTKTALKANPNSMLSTVLIMQGEADSKNKKLALKYKDNLLMLIAGLRYELGNENLKFVIGRVSPNRRYVEIVRQAQEEVAEADSLVELLSTDGLTKYRDNVHYDSYGQIDLGKMFFEKTK